MKCRLCDQYFYEETDFLNLFEFPEVCSSCFTRYAPNLSSELIPIENGIVECIYLYEEHVINVKQREYLMKHWNYLFEYVMYSSNHSAIVLIDPNNLARFPEWFPFIKQWKKILFVSLVRINFEGLMIFF